MTTLARFSVGRIVLHLLAMLGDRCVRFHLAGIMREIAPAMAGSGRLHQLRKLAQSLGPYCLAAAILPGGIVLVPLLFLFRRRKAALEAAMVRSLVRVRSNILKTAQLLAP